MNLDFDMMIWIILLERLSILSFFRGFVELDLPLFCAEDSVAFRVPFVFKSDALTCQVVKRLTLTRSLPFSNSFQLCCYDAAFL